MRPSSEVASCKWETAAVVETGAKSIAAEVV